MCDDVCAHRRSWPWAASAEGHSCGAVAAVRGPPSEHWLAFGQRSSPLSSSARLAINPANALLNYCYGLLEAETRVACLAVGLDPALGILHADVRGRDSLPLDLMEAVRPQVDAYVLDLIKTRTFRAGSFHETGRGNCRILPPLTEQLAATCSHWAAMIASVAERVAAMLAKAPGSRIDRVPTPLSSSNRQAGHAAVRRRPAKKRPQPAAKMPAACHACGADLSNPERKLCDGCLPAYQAEQFRQFDGSGLKALERLKKDGRDPTHGGTAAKRRGDTNVKRKTEVAEWDTRYGKLVDLSAFAREILPLIQGVPLSRLVKAIGLSLRYCSQIRRGEKTPHPRHWKAFEAAARD